jgi:hypothetical protein
VGVFLILSHEKYSVNTKTKIGLDLLEIEAHLNEYMTNSRSDKMAPPLPGVGIYWHRAKLDSVCE